MSFGLKTQVWLEEETKDNSAAQVRLIGAAQTGQRGEPNADVAGKVVAVAMDGKMLTVAVPKPYAQVKTSKYQTTMLPNGRLDLTASRQALALSSCSTRTFSPLVPTAPESTKAAWTGPSPVSPDDLAASARTNAAPGSPAGATGVAGAAAGARAGAGRSFGSGR